MTTTTLVTVYCDACGPGGSELGCGATAATARRQLAGRGWAVNVRESTADRRLDFCPAHKGRRPKPDEHPHEPWPADAPTETGDLIAALRASVEAARERRKAEADGT